MRFQAIRLYVAVLALICSSILSGQHRLAAQEQRPVEYDYLLLATNRTSTMQEEMQEAADSGYAFVGAMGGDTSFGGSEVVVVMQRGPDSEPRFEYRLLATNRTSTMQRELQEAGDDGFEYRGQTVFSTTFGGREPVIILERSHDSANTDFFEYRLLATNQTSTMQDELSEAGLAGFSFVGLTIASTTFGGDEVVAILKRGGTETVAEVRATAGQVVAEVRAKAEQGVAEAQLYLGFMYAVGRGVPQDEAAAARWYELAANQGDLFAQVNLGYMYFEGRGVPQDEVAAVRWFELAANQGDSGAQSMLGFMHFHGQGVSKDDAVAARWFSLAANQGNSDAQANLGSMYFQGQGVPKDYVTAYMWLYLAASRARGNVPDSAVVRRDRLEAELTPNQLAEAQRLAREWEARDVTPSGKTPIPDYAPEAFTALSAPISAQQETVAELQAKAEQGDAEACLELGLRYFAGEGVQQDYAAAAKWYELAAEQGTADAQYNLGVMYSEGRGVPQDDVEAYKWLNLATTYANASQRERYAETRDLVAELLTPQQRAEGQKRAREWFAAHPRD